MEVGRIDAPHFLYMDFKQYCDGWKKLADKLETSLVSQLHDNKELFEEFVTEQLYSGVNGKEEALRPRYSDDPYFHGFKNPEKAADAYKKWKMRIQPPARSYLGFQPRDADTPNLIIRGDFYDSITAVPVADGLMIVSQGVSFSADIERKYGNVIYEIGNKAREHYVKHYMLPRIDKLIKDCGL